MDDQLTFSRHIQQQANKANSIMGLIRRTYSYLDEQSFKYLFQALVRPHLEYAKAMVTIKGRGHRCTRKCPKKSHKTNSFTEKLEYRDLKS